MTGVRLWLTQFLSRGHGEANLVLHVASRREIRSHFEGIDVFNIGLFLGPMIYILLTLNSPNSYRLQLDLSEFGERIFFCGKTHSIGKDSVRGLVKCVENIEPSRPVK